MAFISSIFRASCRYRQPQTTLVRCFASVKDAPAPISDSQFEADASRALERIFEGADASEGESSLHEGVLRVSFPEGEFVLNKHAITKQIWYSSPVIGPAYFDALTAAERRWYSLKLEKDVFEQFAQDVKKLTNIKIIYPPEDGQSKHNSDFSH
jgi:frataxin-like iron-binding protein CyaY